MYIFLQRQTEKKKRKTVSITASIIGNYNNDALNQRSDCWLAKKKI